MRSFHTPSRCNPPYTLLFIAMLCTSTATYTTLQCHPTTLLPDHPPTKAPTMTSLRISLI